MGSKWVDHWTSGTVCECSDIAGSPHSDKFSFLIVLFCETVENSYNFMKGKASEKFLHKMKNPGKICPRQKNLFLGVVISPERIKYIRH
jgi:hypothetical protein